MSFNYADQFSQFLAQKYEKELTSYDLQTSNPQVQFINAHTIRPYKSRCIQFGHSYK